MIPRPRWWRHPWRWAEWGRVERERCPATTVNGLGEPVRCTQGPRSHVQHYSHGWTWREAVPVCVGGYVDWGCINRAHWIYYPAAMCPRSRERVRAHQDLWGPPTHPGPPAGQLAAAVVGADPQERHAAALQHLQAAAVLLQGEHWGPWVDESDASAALHVLVEHLQFRIKHGHAQGA